MIISNVLHAPNAVKQKSQIDSNKLKNLIK